MEQHQQEQQRTRMQGRCIYLMYTYTREKLVKEIASTAAFSHSNLSVPFLSSREWKGPSFGFCRGNGLCPERRLSVIFLLPNLQPQLALPNFFTVVRSTSRLPPPSVCGVQKVKCLNGGLSLETRHTVTLTCGCVCLCAVVCGCVLFVCPPKLPQKMFPSGESLFSFFLVC